VTCVRQDLVILWGTEPTDPVASESIRQTHVARLDYFLEIDPGCLRKLFPVCGQDHVGVRGYFAQRLLQIVAGHESKLLQVLIGSL
jgi:hypothetical protein